MTDTQKRIRAYKKALPFLKERVGVIALLFIMSITMMGSATFAWITLSRAPEVNGLATTIASNGNLEIALSDLDGEAPDETKIGDGSLGITQKNLTWGNLINLSHESYGLSKLTLRPAVLNTGSLLTKPLYSVKYTSDGRISNVISDFAYTNYEEQDGAYDFFVPDVTKYGVRAISSVTYKSVTGEAKLQRLNATVAQKYATADNTFKTLWSNKDYMNTISGLAGVYISWRMSDDGNGGNEDQDCTSYVERVYEMMNEYKTALHQTGEVVLAAANLHYYVYCNQNSQNFEEFTMDQLHDGTVKTTLTKAGITVTGLDPYITDHQKFNGTKAKDYADGIYTKYITNVYEPFKQSESIGWVLMSTYINEMAHINSTTINGTAAQSLGAGDMISLGFASSIVCELKKGLIWNMDWFYGGNISVRDVKTTLMGQTKTINEIRTSVKQEVNSGKKATFPILKTIDEADKKATAGGLVATDATAAESYGMVVDFWLRTNSPNSLLTLAGEVVTERVQVLDDEGNPVLDEEGAVIYETVVLGYSGENRIWEKGDPELPLPAESSTSQGSGSCYIFYPETPEDHAQALEMLSAMRVAFIDEEGTLLAQADMDTTNAFESMGRVLVPLQLRAKSIVTGTDENGNDIVENAFYITQLVQNEATRITAIVYMDGSVLENSNVLSSGSIKGQLNIQFGTSEDLKALDDEIKLESYDIILEADKTNFDKYDPDNKPKVNLELTLNGMDADTISGQFVSYISATQGANQPEFSFEKGEGSTWHAQVEFTGSGNFQLRSVRINGVDYPLSKENIITVEIPGVTVSSIYFEGWDNKNTKKVMTADSVYQLYSELSLNTSVGSTPEKVQGVFANEAGQNVTVDYTLNNNGTYVANTTFTTGGTYTMSYVILDDTYVPLGKDDAGNPIEKKLELYLGLRTQIYMGLPMTKEYQQKLAVINDAIAADIAAYKAANTNATEEELSAEILSITESYKPQKDALYNEYYGAEGMNLKQTGAGYEIIYDGSAPMFTEVSCIVTDDKDNPIRALEDVKLIYGFGAENSIDAGMTWNPGTGRYEGELTFNKPSTYSFNKLEIGKDEAKNVISIATSAPSIRAISPDPMVYKGILPDHQTKVVALNSTDRKISLYLENADSAVMNITVRHNDVNYTFENVSPINENDKNIFTVNVTDAPDCPVYDGVWTIVSAEVSGVVYDGNFFDGSDTENGWLDLTPMIEENDPISTEFINTVYITVDVPGVKNGILEFKDQPFMTQNTIKDIKLSIKDYQGNSFNGITSATVELNYIFKQHNSKVTASSVDMVGYSGKTLTFDANGTATLPELVFAVDGRFDPAKFIIKANDDSTINVPLSNLPPVSVTWVAPTVKISAISPTGPFDADTESGHTTGITPTFNDTAATVYFKCTENDVLCTTTHNYTRPSVTLKIFGFGNATSAEMSFGDVHVYDGTTKAPYKWSSLTASSSVSGVTCARNVGYYKNNSGANDSKTPAGEISSNELILIYDGIRYTFEVETITINNPY